MTDKIPHIGAAGSRQHAREPCVQRLTERVRTEALAEADRYWKACARKIPNTSDEELGFGMAELARDVAFSLWCTLLDAKNDAAPEPPPSA